VLSRAMFMQQKRNDQCSADPAECCGLHFSTGRNPPTICSHVGCFAMYRPSPRLPDERYFDLRPLIDTTVYDHTVAACYETDPRLHHALADARAYRLGWLAWMDSRKRNHP
jgi:hypothetical protein